MRSRINFAPLVTIIAGMACIFIPMNSALAQSAGDEIVVTGTRLDRYSNDQVPNIYLEKKADFVVLEINIENDTRQYANRSNELRKTVLALTKAAENRADIDLTIFKTIEVGYDEVIINSDFTMEKFDDAVTSGSRSDTSRISLVLKTPLIASDTTLEGPYERLEKFYEGITLVGRTLITDGGEPNLSIKSVERYREELVSAIVSDIDRHQQLLPGTQRVEISGLEKPLRWERAGELTLRVYVPYTTIYGLSRSAQDQ